MEQHGNSQTNYAIAIVPARFASERLAGKMLRPIAGKPLLVHTLERVRRARRIDRIIAAVDDQRVGDAVSQFGFEAVITSPAHKSGSDRIAEVARALPSESLIVNVQGDEPLIDPETIDRVVEALSTDPDAVMATVCELISSAEDELFNPNVVKLVCDDDGYARYFSRSPIPFPRNAALANGGLRQAIAADRHLLEAYRKHIGIYGYRREYLLRYAAMPQSELERIESLEQLRALNDRALIRVVESAGTSIGVDTEADYLRVKGIVESGVDIRAMREGEWERIAEVHVASWKQSFRGIVPDDYLESLSIEARRRAFETRPDLNGYAMLVADNSNDGLVGFLDFGAPQSIDEADAEIYSFYVEPGHQRRGIGERLFRGCLSRLKSSGIRSLCLETLEASPFRAFYDKMGGSVHARSVHDTGMRSLPAVIYRWNDITAV